MTAEPNEYVAKVAEAEAAVKSVKDPELRRVAFEKILEHLLAGDGSSPSSPRKKATKSKATKSTKKPNATKSRKGPKARLVELIEEGYFKKQRSIADVKAELANRGHHIPLHSLSGPLLALTKERKLRRQKVAVGRKGSKVTWAYSNW